MIRGAVDDALVRRNWDERPVRPRSVLRDDDRSVPGAHERGIDSGQDLLGAAHRVRASCRERIGDADNGQSHSCAVRQTSIGAMCRAFNAASAYSHHVALSRPQLKRS